MQGHGDGGAQNGNRDRTATAVPVGPTVYACRAGRARPWAARARAWLDALLPCACVLCGQVQAQVVCEGCEADLGLAGGPRRCPQCALAQLAAVRRAVAAPDGRCAICRFEPPAFDAAVTLADYRPPQDTLVLLLKFGGRLAVAHWLGARLADALALRWRQQAAGAGIVAATVTPIPLGPRRLVRRGFNQSWEIARALAARLRLPADPALLARVHDTDEQSGLPLAERHANMAGAFDVTRPDLVAGRHIVLVDDVMTSGATLNEAAAALKRGGALTVTAAVALRTPAPGARAAQPPPSRDTRPKSR